MAPEWPSHCHISAPGALNLRKAVSWVRAEPAAKQFHAAIDMLANAIQACPDSVWFGEGRGAFRYLAFHVLFFPDLYLSPVGEAEFRPPAPFGLTELDEPEAMLPERAYGKDELPGYVNGELLLYNMRHVQHHAAQLNLLLRQATNSAPQWVSRGGRKRRPAGRGESRRSRLS